MALSPEQKWSKQVISYVFHALTTPAELLEDDQPSLWQAAELNDTTNKAKVMAWSKRKQEAGSLF